MNELTYPLFVRSIAEQIFNSPFLDRELLSPHFRLSEFISSDTARLLGIENVPDFDSVLNLVYLCHYVLEPLRSFCGPIHINSGYRCKTLNESLDGASVNSYHLYGRAADIHCPFVSLKVIESYLKNIRNIKYIRYPTFIHVQI